MPIILFYIAVSVRSFYSLHSIIDDDYTLRVGGWVLCSSWGNVYRVGGLSLLHFRSVIAFCHGQPNFQ